LRRFSGKSLQSDGSVEAIKGEDLYETIGQTDDGRYLTIFFIYKGKNQGLVISARDANNREMRSYDKRKK